MPLISEEYVAAYARATGTNHNHAREKLRRIKEPLRSRIVRAAMTQASLGSQELHDPIEDEPLLRQVLEQAEQEAKMSLADQGVEMHRGYCHLFWEKKAEILADRYGITWFSPADMNPYVLYD